MTLTTQQALDEAARKERRASPEDRVAYWDAVSRKRALSDDESRQLERAINEAGQKMHATARIRWTAEMDADLLRLRQRGETFKAIAKYLDVPTRAAASRGWRLRGMQRNGN